MKISPNKVLIVDDEPNILLSLDFLMRKEGYLVFIARDGQEALDILQKEAIDLVILDIMMPRVDGYQVCQFIRQNTDFQHIKIIVMSAKSREADIQKGYDSGANLYLTKPFSTRTLVSQISTLLEEKTIIT